MGYWDMVVLLAPTVNKYNEMLRDFLTTENDEDALTLPMLHSDDNSTLEATFLLFSSPLKPK